MIEWIRTHEALIGWLGLFSIVFFVGSLLLTPFLLARIPTDYFAEDLAPPRSWSVRHPLGRLLLRIARNLLGLLLIGSGIAMLVLPGQGILTILLGMFALDYPGKRALEMRILRVPRIHRAIDWFRRRASRPPLRIAGTESSPPNGERREP